MKMFIPLALTSALLITACGSTTEEKADTAAAVDAPVLYNYTCESGEAIVATYPADDAAMVNYKGSDYTMKVEVSGSGSRYVGGDLEWWTKGTGKGSEGTLFKHMADGTTGEVIESCTAS